MFGFFSIDLITYFIVKNIISKIVIKINNFFVVFILKIIIYRDYIRN